MTKEHKEMITREISLKEVEDYIRRHKVVLTKGWQCVDGRAIYASEHSSRASRAGGDFGYVMAAIALGIQPKAAVDIVHQARKKDGIKFYTHTDTHVDPESEMSEHKDHRSDVKPLTGCGHAAKAALAENHQAYVIDPQKVKEAWSYVESLRQKYPNEFVRENLPGNHAELAVIKNKGRGMSVYHNNDTFLQGEGLQFFVYDETLDLEEARRLANEFGLDENEYIDVLNKQTMATLSLIAKNKPVLETDADENEVTVSKIGIIS